jgi:hypothetical protein
MTSPVEFPMYGKFKKLQLSKENLLAFWDMILNRADFNVSTGEKVADIKKTTTASSPFPATTISTARATSFSRWAAPANPASLA